MTSYIGLHVATKLADGSTLTGTIEAVDAQRNVLILRTESSQSITIERTKIQSLSVVQQQPQRQQSQKGKSPQKATVPTSEAAPDVSKLPQPGKASREHGESSKKPSKAKANKSKAKKAQGLAGNGRSDAFASSLTDGAQNSSSSSSIPADDFDFEASLRTFDKAKIWQEIRANDTTDPAGRLVAHNRLPGVAARHILPESSSSSSSATPSRNASPAPRGRGANASGISSDKMRKLRPDENVLSPSPPPTPPCQEPAAADLLAPRSTSDGDLEGLRVENDLLRRRLTILQNLAGFHLEPLPSSGPLDKSQPIEFDCALVPSLGAASTSPLPPLRFHLGTTLDPSDPKLRFRPAAQSSEQSTPSTPLPDKYRREMGLRLDNGSARVFFERVRNSIEPNNGGN